MSNVVERFLRYVKVDTQSAHESRTAPSTEKQKVLGEMLAAEMRELGIEEVYMSEAGCVYGSIPSNVDGSTTPAVGFISHMDTSPDASGTGVKPWIVKNYDGKDIVLNQEKGIVMEAEKFAHLQKYIGQDLIVTDGTTLLGGDDKAGIAAILSMAEYFLTHPEEKHGSIKLGFTPDEEVGRGTENFDLERFGADFAYTVDGDAVGIVSEETFNAADAKLFIHGKSMHPGESKNKMVNAILIAVQFQNMLPEAENPIHTEGREGYYHITNFEGGVEQAYLKYLIRDHDRGLFEERKNRIRKIVNYLNDIYGEGTIDLEITDTYYNMAEVIGPVHYIVDHVKEVITNMGINLSVEALRGGTDGAWLSFRGLPCPNISAGYQNAHGHYEYVSTKALETNTELLANVVKSFVK